MKSIKSWFFIVLLITVIAYLSIKPESFEGLDISNSNTRNDISKNIIYTYDAYDTESDMESDTESDMESEEKESTYTEMKSIIDWSYWSKWFDFDTYSVADFIFITLVIILFCIILFLLTKL
jgi:hypothetical protein